MLVYLCVLSHFGHVNSLQAHGLWPSRLLCPWDSPGKNTGVGCQALLQRIFQTQGLKPLLLNVLHWQGGFFITSATWETSPVAPIGKNLSACRRHGFSPWFRKIFRRRAWQPTPVFLSGELHWQRSLAGYSPWGCKESDTIEQLTLNACRTCTNVPLFISLSLSDEQSI